MTMPDDGKFHGVLNELSFGARDVGASDPQVVLELGRTLRALRNAVSTHDLSRVVFVVPSGLGAYSLPGGTSLSGALASLDFEGRDLLLSLLSGGPWFDDAASTMLHVDGFPARALEEVLSRDGLAISLNVPPWQTAKLSARQQAIAAEPTDVVVLNTWNSSIEDVHRSVIDKHVPVLPKYDDDDNRHDPDSTAYIKGKSHRPRSARRILRHAIPDPTVVGTWWARCEHDFIHRFSGSLHGPRWWVHWNGTTNLKSSQITRAEDVPGPVRKRLYELEPARDCGCRELDDP
jgi:hypothetical protein